MNEARTANFDSPRIATAKRRYAILRFLLAAFARCVVRLFQSLVKVLIKRTLAFDEEGLFLRQCFLHLTGVRPIRRITCVGFACEGAGSQALMIMNAINFARAFGLVYVHTPFSFIEHADRPMDDWVKGWETLFNLGAGEVPCKPNRFDAVNFSYAYRFLSRNAPHFYELELCFDWRPHAKDMIAGFTAMIPELRAKYYLNKSPRTTEELTVAVHVRRGDVSAATPHHFTPDEVILHTITQVKEILEAARVPHRMCVYSQGDKTSFADLGISGIECFLNADPMWTIQQMVEADVLITAKSCYSYCAGLLSDGIKIFDASCLSRHLYLPLWHSISVPALETWVPCQADGSLDAAAFESQLALILQTKPAAAAKGQVARAADHKYGVKIVGKVSP